MSLDHDFILLDRTSDGEWELTRFIHDPRAIHLHDDLIRYMHDTLVWIPAYNPATSQPCNGLNVWGVTLIEHHGAAAGERLFRAWARLLENGPATIQLTGAYSEDTGSYEQLRYLRDDTVHVLSTLADYCVQVQMANGRLYIYHGGV